MSAPVFVIHGVANRDRDGFTAAVAALQAATGISMVPVYWGDLGAEDRFISAALPARDTAPVPTVGTGGGLRDETQSALPHYLFGDQPRTADQFEIIDTALRKELRADVGPLRDAAGLGRPTPDDIMDVCDRRGDTTVG
ncbi:hypothetical protein [Streptomyces sp. NBC_00140]|uniref:hypothetical protein n=1 Tax=Streptomyces sp. NBC_00140 TaxID=2975664 RepID=UPI00225465CA|nr:hypothetical protein [Streptomyces sp. NBC_00140]MCX5328373.1 hypothetical protein [Streptomyces sp. NBC_00140]